MPRTPPQITEPVTRQRQVADYLRDGILSGDFPAGQPLPSEERLADLFGVSRHVIRQAVTTLVGEGLLIVRRPHGTIVRDPHARPAHLDHRGLTLADGHHTETEPVTWQDIDPPAFVRADATAAQADLFNIPPGQPMLTRDVLQQANGLRRSVRLHMPFSVAADLDTPWLDDPHLPEPVQVYDWFHSHGHPLTFTEYVRARMPVGDETTALRITPGTPLLVIARTATTAGRVVTLEQTRIPGDQTELAYPLTTTSPAAPASKPATRTRRTTR
ncbi:GntR family transcriptional regulator [Phytohabitans rumicis]|uniref:GntR family transcriptional regulator n=1 Tax=Phytohabitans rumicis TaxID=1076125 RepID=A0A6V8LAF8_9ACTN|nr:GntR family transcriptional regulator [Phytohabitans rumicis]GFJ91056.1 GntR family transcriptional regulator [Phytohabitans rumicis]